MEPRPEWWDWELEVSWHAAERMEDRRFSETDLRRMLEDATSVHKLEGRSRWKIETRHDGRDWRVIVEPEADRRVLVVVTAYALETP